MTWLVIHSSVTWALLGLIWTIQLVHYPLFKNIESHEFVDYHERHMARISWVVGPLMLAEAGTALLLLYLGERSWVFGISLVSLAWVWGSTVLCQIPLHEKLSHGYHPATIGRLVRTNWWRTVAWTIRGLCLVTLLIQKLH
jgi:hypothetical protein